MTDRIAKLEAALRINAALCVQAERLIAAYITTSGSDKAAIVSELVRLFDGPAQREAKRLTEIALGEARAGEEGAPALPIKNRKAPRRFWAEVIVGFTTGLLCVLTLLRPDWIEAISGGFDPDQHDGTVEWLIGMAMLVITLAALGAFPWITTRQDHPTRDWRVG